MIAVVSHNYWVLETKYSSFVSDKYFEMKKFMLKQGTENIRSIFIIRSSRSNVRIVESAFKVWLQRNCLRLLTKSFGNVKRNIKEGIPLL
jgi:hypothetical protein